MAQDSSDVVPNPSAASTAIQIDSTLNIIPPRPKVEPQGFDKIREKLKPLLLYIVSMAQFLDIGNRQYFLHLLDTSRSILVLDQLTSFYFFLPSY